MRNKIIDINNFKRQVIKEGHLLNETLSTDGWKAYIEPLIDDMISNIIGKKNDNHKYSQGDVDIFENIHKVYYYMGYKQSLMDLINKIYNKIEDSKREKSKILNNNG
ncbi:MAG: hypothetical protein O6940_05890 [Ignavibacteria bacterium]|nr:hypothetical protein [Ignavibacteria bacterium]